MFAYSLLEISQVVSGNIIGKGTTVINQFFTDSRKVLQGTSGLFFAIKGVNHDGHIFVEQVYTFGVRNFVVCNSTKIDFDKYPDANFIIVDNVLFAFQLLASYHRSVYELPVIGVVGSNGKTIVKEWLNFVLKTKYSIVRSPKSYNSQIGVPLSVMLINEYHNMGIFEAGISEVGEMEKLQPIIDPKVVVFTNVGNAHQENFDSLEQKVYEKLQLAREAELLIYCADYEIIKNVLEESDLKHLKTLTWGIKRKADVMIRDIKAIGGFSEITAQIKNKAVTFRIPFTDRASIENAIHCFMVLFSAGMADRKMVNQFKYLPQVAMRLELKEGINNCTVINDYYNSDIEGIRIAIDFLNQQKQHIKKTVILSDIQQSDLPQNKIYEEINDIVSLNKIDRLICIGEKIASHANQFSIETEAYRSTREFLESFRADNFKDEVILLKGARVFEFERISRLLEYKTHQTVLEINLNAIISNLNYFRSLLNDGTKLMVMVKAFSYGSGSFEIANLLQHNRVDYLAVAFVDEGVDLRKSGITLPIVVMNPEIHSFGLMIKNNLEPEIYNIRSLLYFIRALDKLEYTQKYNVHLKIDTGMKRMGFEEQQIDEVLSIIKNDDRIRVASVFSHLAGSDESRFDDFTEKQITLFSTIAEKIEKSLGKKVLKHILNSAGIERFTKFQFDMVRLGIGLYGISTLDAKTEHISTLKTAISQIKTVQANETVGYSRKGVVKKETRIAVLPIGYADGLSRALSNGVGEVLVDGKRVPVIGNICMDACMVDVTGVNANEGDEVIIFGKDLPITDMAKRLQTIPYEILTGISRRVKRVYFQE